MFTLHQDDKFYQTTTNTDDPHVQQLNSRIISVHTQDVLLQPTVYAAFKMVGFKNNLNAFDSTPY